MISDWIVRATCHTMRPLQYDEELSEEARHQAAETVATGA